MAEKEDALQKLSTMMNDEIKIVVDGTDRKSIEIEDVNKTKHRLLPLTVKDLIDFEDRLGVSIMQIMSANLTIKHIFFLLYLSIRKEGCSAEDIKLRKYKYTEDEIGEMFDLSFVRLAVPIFTNLLNISGFRKKEKETNPQEPIGLQASKTDTTIVSAEPSKA